MTIHPAGIEGIITAAEIRYEHIRYEVTYWNPLESCFSTSWHHESELVISGKVERKQIGYNK